MLASSPFYQKRLDLSGRSFLVQILRFENGSFLSISEGKDMLGSMVASLGSSPSPVATTIIPAKTDSLFLKLIASKISATCKGISIVSCYTAGELDSETAKDLMTGILKMVADA